MSSSAPGVSIHLFGAPEIRVAGTSLNLNHIKVRALLFYLAATGQAHTRDHLATLLWGESNSGDAHHSLRSSLYRLRQALPAGLADELLISNGELLGLRPGAYACDVLEFRHLLEDGAEAVLAGAVALYRGPFLEGFSLADAPLFDEWVREEEIRLSQACLDVLERLAGAAEAREDWGAAIDYCQNMAWMEPLAELVQQRLMRLYLRKGEVGLAVNQYRHYENRVQSELGIGPSPEIKALLYEALGRQQNSGAPNAASANPTQAGQPMHLPFVGRERLLQQLMEISREVQGSSGRTVLLEGEGGVGKSRLLDELSARLIGAATPWLVLRGACSPFDDLLSHGPFLEALQNGAPDELNNLMAEPDFNLPDTRGHFSWRILQIIRSLTGTVPLMLIIEDLQWANSATLNLFGLLSMRLRPLPVLLVGTVQHVPAVPSLQRLISLGRRRGELHQFSLAPLTLDAVSTLLKTSGIHAGLVETLAEWLHARSAGSPYLLTEILAQLRSEAILLPVGDGWQLDTSRWFVWRTTFMLPETSYDLVAWRLADLSAEARHFLNVLALAGQALPSRVVRECLGGGEHEAFISLVEDLGTRGLIIEPPGSLLALPHHLLRETLLRRLSDLRRRAIYQQLAQALEAYASPDSETALRQIAMYAVAGEDVTRARRYGLRLLRDLPQEYTGEETVDFVHHLHDLLASSASAEEMVQLTHALGTLHQFLGHLHVAADWHRKNLEWAVLTGNFASQAEAYFEMSDLALMSNDFQAAMQTAREGLSKTQAVQDSHAAQPLMARGQRLLGAAFAMDGSDLREAQQHLQEAVRINRETGNARDLCAALFELGNTAAQRGELRDALAFYDESARTAESSRVHYFFALARNNFSYHSLLLGQIDAAREAVTQGLRVAEAFDLLAALLHLYSTKGEIFLYLGEWDEAEESFRRGLALAEDLGSLERQAGYRLGLALVARGRKDLETAVRLLVEALALIGERGYWHLHTRLQIWLAETLFEQSHFAEAAQLLDPAVALARAHQRVLLLAQGECLHAQLLAANGDWPAADRLFNGTLDSMAGLGLPLETARVQAAWGRTARHYSPTPEQGRALLDSARRVFVAHNARADLAEAG